MAYIDTIVEALQHASDPLTVHELADAIDAAGPGSSGRRPGEATIGTWLYSFTGSHDHPGIHRLDRTQSGRGCTCWICDQQQTGRASPH